MQDQRHGWELNVYEVHKAELQMHVNYGYDSVQIGLMICRHALFCPTTLD